MERRVLLVLGAVLVELMLVSIYVMSSGQTDEVERPSKSRAQAIPSGAVKMTPLSDQHPPVLHSTLWQAPIPLPGPVNTAGAEDSAFVLPDGSSLYFFFTPDVGEEPQEQILDEVSGIWRSDWNGTGWEEPVRIWLQEPGKLALDGAAFVLGERMWFASAREGHAGVNLFTAGRDEGGWGDWQYAGDLLNQQYQVGEMHITCDGRRMYFHSSRAGGSGGTDIWYTDLADDGWQAPVNVEAVNTAANEAQPFISPDGSELWFTRIHLGSPGVFRSSWNGSGWGVPELVLSSFAGEPTLDAEGNLYFVHHSY